MAQYSKQWWYPTGDPAASVRAIVFEDDSATLAPLFSDPGLTFPIVNPTSTSPSGLLSFYVADGQYWVYVGDDFSGDSELVTVGPVVSGTVLSVNGQTGIVILDSTDIGAQPIGTINAKGDLYAGTANDATTRLPVGTDGQILSANSATGTGLQWIASTSSPVTSVNGQTGVVVLTAANVGAQPIATIDAKGDLYAGTADNATARLPVGADGRVLTANSAMATGLEWTVPPSAPVTSVNGQTGVVVLTAANVGAIATTLVDAKGDLITATADDTPVRLPVGTDGRVLTANSAMATGLEWTVPPSAPVTSVNGQTGVVVLTAANVGAIASTLVDAKGDILTATADDVPARLPVGVDGEILKANSATATGLEWVSPGGGGDVSGPASATDNALARFDGITGKLIQNSSITLDDLGTLTFPGQIAIPAVADGQLYYSSNFKTLMFDNTDPDGTLSIGRQTWIEVRNETGFTIGKGTAVYVSNHQELFPYPPIVSLAQANSDSTAHVLGLAAHVIENNTNGYVCIEGYLSGFPTVGYNHGDYIYLSASGAGGITNVRPVAPNLAVVVAIVTAVDISHGTMSVIRGTPVLGFGTANQVLGMNAAATAEEYKTLQGTASRLTVTQGVGTVTFDVDNTLLNTKVDKATLGAKGSLISATAPAAPVDLPVGTNNQYLMANSATASGLQWDTITAGDVGAVPTTRLITTSNGITGGGDLSVDRNHSPVYGTTAGTIAQGDDARITGAQQRSTLTTKGDIYAATAASTTTRLPVGTNGQVIRANSATGTGLEYVTLTATDFGGIPVSIVDVKGDLIAASAADTVVRFPAGTNGQVIRANSATGTGLEYATLTSTDVGAQPIGTIDAKGDLYVGLSDNTTSRQPVGANGQFLRANSLSATGLDYATPTAADVGAIPLSLVDVKGDIIVATADNVVTRMPAGPDGLFLRTNSALALGLEWVNAVNGPLVSTDNAIVRWSGVNGTVAKNSNTILDDAGNITLFAQGEIFASPPIGSISRSTDTISFRNQYTSMALGSSLYMKVRNNTGASIPRDSAVYINGVFTSGLNSYPTIALARADATATAQAIGMVVGGAIPDVSFGFVAVEGQAQLDTSAFATTNILYLSATTAGALTNVQPSSPNLTVRMGTVINASALFGFISLRPEPPLPGLWINGSVAVTASASPGGFRMQVPNCYAQVPTNIGFSMIGGIHTARSTPSPLFQQMYLVPFAINIDETMSQMVFEVTTAANGGGFAIAGLYAAEPTTFRPFGPALVNFGGVATDGGPGLRSIPSVIALTPGIYYYALSAQGAPVTGQWRFTAGFSPYVQPTVFPSGNVVSMNNAWVMNGVFAGPLPPIGAITDTIAPLIGLGF